MPLKLVVSGDGRACAIRDHLVRLVRAGGGLEVQRGPVRLITLEQGPWSSITGRPSMSYSRKRHPRPDIGMRSNGNIPYQTWPMAWRCGTASRC